MSWQAGRQNIGNIVDGFLRWLKTQTFLPRPPQMPLRAWMVVGLMHMPEKPSLLASWVNAKRGSVGSKVCPGASRATATCQIIFNACTISRISNMSLCIVSDMAAREIESVCARARARARVRALNPKPYLGTDFWEFLPGERGEGPSRPSGVDVSAPARSRRAAAEAMRRRANHQRPVQEWREAEVVYMLKSKNNVYTRTYYIYIHPKFL